MPRDLWSQGQIRPDGALSAQSFTPILYGQRRFVVHDLPALIVTFLTIVGTTGGRLQSGVGESRCDALAVGMIRAIEGSLSFW